MVCRSWHNGESVGLLVTGPTVGSNPSQSYPLNLLQYVASSMGIISYLNNLILIIVEDQKWILLLPCIIFQIVTSTERRLKEHM